MKIINIQNINTPSYLQTKPQNNSQNMQNIQQPEHFGKLPSTMQYLAFTGGYSLNLSQTIKQLDKLAEKNSTIYPPNIREWLALILENGNKAKETLIGGHKKYFASLKDCFTLEEIKARFPEFRDVIPSTKVSAQENSFISKFQKGELEYFDGEEDLSVQLIKLYWGEGFSLNDLKHYAGGQDLYYTMKKLNIPTASRDYGHILKFSDAEYNERLGKEMAQKRLEAMDRKAQLQDGEPVYIPSKKRGPLSEEWKKHISEGLIKHWQENPERIYEMSERQIQYYIDNPERAKDFKRVLNRAWNIFGADRIKQAMSKFFKNKKVDMFDVTNPLEMTPKQKKTTREFWGQNEWAKKMFSKNMKHAWKKVKEENETFFTLRSTPTQLTRYIEEKAGMPAGTLKNETKFNLYTHESSVDEQANEICRKYTNVEGLSNVMADTYQLAVINIAGKLKDIRLSRKNRPFNDLFLLAADTVRSNTLDNGYKVQYTEEAQQDFVQLAAFASQSKCPELVDIVNKALDESFELALSIHKECILK